MVADIIDTEFKYGAATDDGAYVQIVAQCDRVVVHSQNVECVIVCPSVCHENRAGIRNIDFLLQS